jgi:predicted transcriptional regulator
MGERPQLSKGELSIARLLWEIGPATVRQVHSAMPVDRPMDFSTVQTYLRRLEAKAYASSCLAGRTRVYKALAKPQTVIRDTVDDLIARLFGGEAMPLVRHLIEDRAITPTDVAELRTLVEQLEQRGGNS